MKKQLYVAIVIALCCALPGVKASEVNQQSEKDSIIVTFGNKTRLIIYGENRSELDKIMKYDLNALLRDLHVKLDSSRADTTYLREEVDGKRYLKNKSDEDYVRIGVRGVHVKDGNTEVRIGSDGVSVRDADNDDDKDKDYKRIGKNLHRSRSGSSPRKGFAFALGLNTYGSNDPGGIYNKEDYDLRPFGSRFVSLGYITSAKIVRGQKAGFHLDFGIDFSWFNLMYDGNNTITKLSDRVDFPLVEDADGNEVELRKSKLVVPNVNLSLMPTVSFKNSFVSYVSAGVYGGYRLGSYSKVRRVGTKDNDRERINYYLNDFRYGLAAEIGFKNFVDLFVNYDLNTLHETNRGPKVNMLSFGIKL